MLVSTYKFLLLIFEKKFQDRKSMLIFIEKIDNFKTIIIIMIHVATLQTVHLYYYIGTETVLLLLPN